IITKFNDATEYARKNRHLFETHKKVFQNIVSKYHLISDEAINAAETYNKTVKNPLINYILEQENKIQDLEDKVLSLENKLESLESKVWHLDPHINY
ncbi:MAG: hypothetical protein Q7R95_06550, partial [bacterium]|nr:hypothetical protein [bacterium]